MATLDSRSKVLGMKAVVLLSLLSLGHCMIEEIPVPRGLEDCFSRYAAKTDIAKTVGQSINWICVHQYMWTMNGKQRWMTYNVTGDANRWFGSLLQFTRRRNVIRFRRQTRRGRKEIRMLTDKERYDLFRAINLMKADTSVYPNRYDAIAALHQGITETSAHGGPNFLGWHRVYVTMFENALREYIPSVTVPYWDSTLDDKMQSPEMSVIWSNGFFGDGNGIVTNGPFGRWMTPSGPLIRNAGNGGQLFRQSDIRRVLSRRRVHEITEPMGPTASNLEFHHGEVHLYVDGQMADLTTASHDPIFFFHHCYVDYIWELFRRRQRMMGINPARDYPRVVNHTLHLAQAPLGLGNLRNIDSFSESMIAGMYHYEPSPHCSARYRNCGSPYLTCQNVRREWTCVSIDRSTASSNSQVRTNMGSGLNNVDIRILMNTQNMRNMQNDQNSRIMQGRNPNMVQPEPSGNANIGRNPSMVQPEPPSSANFDLNRILKANNIDPNIMIPIMRDTDRRKMVRGAFMASQMSQNMSPGEAPIMINTQRGNMMVSVQRDSSNPASFEINHMIMNQTMNRGMPAQNLMSSQIPAQGPPMPSPDQSGSGKDGSCPAIPVNQPYQNTFNINGRSDTRQWVYLPVNIVYRRPPEYKRYNSFAIYNGKPYTTADIYSPDKYQRIKTRLNVDQLAGYRSCNTGKAGAGAVFIQSNGINYIGNYKEYAIVDHRMAISMSTAFVAVKDPQRGVTEVLLSAHDSCGRVCRPFCNDPNSSTGALRKCTGMLRINSQFPKHYGTDYGEAVYSTWNLQDPTCPHLDRSNIFVTFYCDYEDLWPLPGIVPPPPPTMPVLMSMQVPIPVPGMHFSSSMTIVVCKLRNGCILRDQCAPCVHGSTIKCEKTCSLYARCNRGFYEPKSCIDGKKYNPQTGLCEPGTCPEEEIPPPLKTFLPTTPSPSSRTTVFDDR